MDVPDLIALVGLALTGGLLLGVRVVGVVRDSDRWVIARGIATGKRARLARAVGGARTRRRRRVCG